MEVLFLGTGTSHGVPMIACDCAVCTSDDPRDKRNRPCLLIRCGQENILIDTPPELRVAALRWDVRSVDHVLYTHHHADHIFGLDDLRRFNHLRDAEITCYGSERSLSEIRQTFRYAFGTEHLGGGLPVIRLQPVNGSFPLAGFEVQTLQVMHGPTPVLGYRMGGFAYVTDVKTIPRETREQLRGLDVLVLGVLRHRPHPTHLSVAEALDVLDDLRPRKAYFTHIAHDLGHAATEADLPPDVRLAYDGLSLSLEDPEPHSQASRAGVSEGPGDVPL